MQAHTKMHTSPNEKKMILVAKTLLKLILKPPKWRLHAQPGFAFVGDAF